jgi:hypothetical protein
MMAFARWLSSATIVELVGWSADAHPVCQHILKFPGVGPIHVEADGEVLHDRHRGRRTLQLPIDLVLQPLVKADSISRL